MISIAPSFQEELLSDNIDNTPYISIINHMNDIKSNTEGKEIYGSPFKSGPKTLRKRLPQLFVKFIVFSFEVYYSLLHKT